MFGRVFRWFKQRAHGAYPIWEGEEGPPFYIRLAAWTAALEPVIVLLLVLVIVIGLIITNH